MIGDVEDEEYYNRPLGRWPVFVYGVGHMLNDITSACWFTYLLVFLTDIGLSPGNAAIVMLSGQVADGFMTAFSGELIDRFGRFKIWHGAGSLLVAVSFSSVFGGCIPCKIFGTDSSALETIGYSIFAAIFNIGWAATQVSHMSMVNCMTLNPTSRVVLASCRNAFTMIANLSLYAVAFVVFGLGKSRTHDEIESQYRWIAYSSIFIGCCFVCIFLVGTKEPRLKDGFPGKVYARVEWTYWFHKVLYYQVALVYVLTRLVTNVSQSFLAFYVINDLQMAQSSKALVPAIIYICSFIISIILQEMSWNGYRLKTFFSIGSVLWIFCGVAVLFLPLGLSGLMYIISVIIGIANALMMVTGIGMQSVLVGQDLNGSAFVYGSLSFMDKMGCGIVLYVLESYHSNVSSNVGELHSSVHSFSVTRYAVGIVPAICALIGVAVTYSMKLETPPKPITEPLLA
ncbi:major facilitator superfamily domain-containing protein 12-like [Chenopodium quinoa]|uniref:major facilitator superfamily domain-containing protein 12-like n=1 Tax=Chenopodium quinoa TaxID=63459 RepID=UPI000B76D102|nr:major facilitator superfamily domain-containing protein 12-like [Chenopodium quinoa]XP_021722513.1 major facilitator superfamily domain-containing protein 12-like [Chenopodium quinoa]XP_021722514.1 major facilitator superfamily domain-containing protein 12-like [Chenopodium quinoa]XP_021722515.1 major facilitator superfamily domain-containing protein 12-like [Chenopodium quinoa]